MYIEDADVYDGRKDDEAQSPGHEMFHRVTLQMLNLNNVIASSYYVNECDW